jgi:peptide/nickel transport system substrate-binding protein
MALVRARRWRGGLALVAVAALLFAACSDDDDGGSSADTTAVEEGNRDAVARIGYDLLQPGAAQGFQIDPVKSANETNDGVQYAIFGRLMRPQADGSLEPDLAETVTIVDPNTIDIELREGLTFSDGSPFDAAAVKAGMERSKASGATAFGAFITGLQAVEVTGPTSLRLTIANGTAPSWHDTYLGAWQSTIVKETASGELVGAGPFKVTSYEPGAKMVLEPSEGFWDAENVTYGGVELINTSAEQAQSGINALRADQIDLVLTEVSQLPSLTDPLDYTTLATSNRITHMPICKRDAPLNDPKVRQALNKAIDRDGINDAVFGGVGQPVNQPWPEGYKFYDPDLADVLSYDPDGAKQLLTEAGYPTGIDVEISVLPNRSSPAIAEIVEQQWAAVGIRGTITNAPNIVAEFYQPQKAGVAMVPSFGQGRQRLTSWSGTSVGNACKWADPALDALVADLAKVSDSSDEAVEIWGELNDKIVNEALDVFIINVPLIGAYDTEAILDPVAWPLGSYFFLNPFEAKLA